MFAKIEKNIGNHNNSKALAVLHFDVPELLNTIALFKERSLNKTLSPFLIRNTLIFYWL